MKLGIAGHTPKYQAPVAVGNQSACVGWKLSRAHEMRAKLLSRVEYDLGTPTLPFAGRTNGMNGVGAIECTITIDINISICVSKSSLAHSNATVAQLTATTGRTEFDCRWLEIPDKTRKVVLDVGLCAGVK